MTISEAAARQDSQGVGATRRVLACAISVVVAFTAMLLAVSPAHAAAVSPPQPVTTSSPQVATASSRKVAQLPANGAPDVHHVWYIMLENSSFAENFGSAARNDPRTKYLAKTLPSTGALLTNYYGIAHPSTSNWIGAISGQPPSFGYTPGYSWDGPSPQWAPCDQGYGVHFCLGTQLNCPAFVPFQPVDTGSVRTNVNGVQTGSQGCVYGSHIKTVADQVETQGLKWKAYMQKMGTPCRHPNLNAIDPTSINLTEDEYETGENPFMYFSSVINNPTCQQNDVDLNQLPRDLRLPAASAPNFSFIGLSMCALGHNICIKGYKDRLVSTRPCPINPSTQARDLGCLAPTIQANRRPARKTSTRRNPPACIRPATATFRTDVLERELPILPARNVGSSTATTRN